MNCPECDDLLQQRLDGLDGDTQDALELHLAVCRDCRELNAAAELLEEGLLALRRPTPPPDLADRIVARVLAEQPAPRARQRRLVAVAAAAACLLAMPLAGLFLTPSPSVPARSGLRVARLGPKSAPAPAPAPPLRRSAEEAGSAVASLTDQLTGRMREQARMLLTAATPPELPPMDPLQAAAELPSPLDSAQSLRDAGQGVSAGLETVASSARRAFDYFFRELPALEPGPRTVQ